MNRRKRFGETLVEAGVVTAEELQKALTWQKGSGKRLGQILEEMGVVSEKDTAETLAHQFGFKRVQNLVKYRFAPEVLSLVEGQEALRLNIFPLKREGRILFLAMVNPLDMDTINNLAFQTGLRVIPCVTTPREILTGVHKHYMGLAEEQEGPDWRTGWKILVVEDQELARSAISAALKREGFETREAGNGAEGLKAACQNPPHLIVTDTLMPKMDGFELFRALKSNSATRDIPVIGLSSKSSPEEEAKLLAAGYFDFISKPINTVRLVARVRRALRMVYGTHAAPPARPGLNAGNC